MPNLPAMCLTLAARRNAQAPLASVEARTYIAGMVRISISPAAFDAIAATLPGNVGFENKRDSNGDWFIWSPHDVLAKLNALRGPGDDHAHAAETRRPPRETGQAPVSELLCSDHSPPSAAFLPRSPISGRTGSRR
jgi:hypothetical protein